MNPIVIVQLAVGVLNILVALPLICRRIAPNRWYGIRLPAAFVSKENWYSLNESGGRLLRVTGVVIALVGLAGLGFGPPLWPAYDVAALAIDLLVLARMILRCYQLAKRLPQGPIDPALVD